MGNRISWKRKIVTGDTLNDVGNHASRKTSDSHIPKLQINVKHEEHDLNQQQISVSQKLFPKKLKSNIHCDKPDVIHSSTKNLNNGKLKSNSEVNPQLRVRSKLLNKMKFKSLKSERRSTTTGEKRNQSLARARTWELRNESEKQFRTNKSDCRGTHPISSQGREIIQACFSNHHNEIGYRIFMRVFEKRPDYQRFVHALGKEKWLNSSTELRDYLNNVVSKVHDVTAIEEISRNYGEQHVPLKKYGFKPDFWVSIADAIAIECVILDMANHQPTETVMAWSQLTSLMFTSIRDGYYAALRFQRQMLKNCKNSEWRLTIDSISSLNDSAPSIAEKFES
ncbi:globin [Onchocerca flexuosa]|uniref:Globin n=1 Tax=Onchocerca flexuosa TaxID=387005 RepID=A0A238BWG3_9BILA|nr:globin [Onchocerca flexuosa]